MNTLLSNSYSFFQKAFKWLLQLDLVNHMFVLSLHISLLLFIIYILRKPLRRIASARILIRVLSSSIFLQLLLKTILPWQANLLDIREYIILFTNSWPDSLFHIGISGKINSHIAGIPDTAGFDWLMAANIIWLLGVIASYLIAYLRKRPVSRMFEQYAEKCPREMERMFERMLDTYPGIPFDSLQRPTLWYVEGAASPCVYNSWFETKVIINRLDYSEDELKRIFHHEIAHIAFRHPIALSTMRMLRNFCWFNPVMHIAYKWLSNQAELLSDECTMNMTRATTNERISYARLLVELAERRHLQGAALYLSASAAFIQQRVEAILNPRKRDWTIPVTILMILVMMCMPLLVDAGVSADVRFGEKDAIMASFGNTDREIQRSLTNWQKRNFKDWEIDGGNKALTMFGDSDEGLRLARICGNGDDGNAYLREWISYLDERLGEHTFSVRDDDNYDELQIYRWKVEISDEFPGNDGFSRRPVFLTLLYGEKEQWKINFKIE